MLNKFVEYSANILFEEYEEGNPEISDFLESRNLKFSDIENYSIGYIRKNNPLPKFVKMIQNITRK